MCDCEDNPPACGSKTVRKASKDHRCYECAKTIRAGDLYTLHTGVWDGRGESFKWCHDCSTVYNLIRAVDDEFCFCFGTLIESVEESLRWVDPPPTPWNGLTTKATAYG